MSTANDPTRETTIRLSQQSLDDIDQIFKAAFDKQQERLEVEMFEEFDKRLGEFGQAFGAKHDELLERLEGVSKKLHELANLVAEFTTAPNTTFERAKL